MSREVAEETFYALEIDQPQCALRYGTTNASGTCNASLGTSGLDKCHNTKNTCQDLANYTPTVTIPLRFVRPQEMSLSYAPFFPILASLSVAPASINLAGMERGSSAFGQREVVTARLFDCKHSDDLLDPYRLERQTGAAQSSGVGYDPYERGTFWAKWVARNPYYSNYRARVRRGKIGQPLGEMQVRHYLVDNISGPDAAGNVTIKLKDLFTKVEARKAVYPLPSTGKLSAAITGTPSTFTATPSGIGSLPEDQGGYAHNPKYVRIGDECIEVTRSSDVFTVVARGALGTKAEDHDQDETIQAVGELAAAKPHEHIYTLLTGYVKLAAGDINKADWDVRMDSFQFSYSTYVTEPVPVDKLIGELEEQAGLSVWPDPTTNLVELRVLQADAGDPTVDEDTWLMQGSLSTGRQDSKRVSRVLVHFGPRNFAGSLDDSKNYHQSVLVPTLSSEGSTEYGSMSLRVVHSRWIQVGGLSSATATATRIASLFRDPPREATFRLFASRAGALGLAEPFVLKTSSFLNKDTGERLPVTMMPVQLFEDEHDISVRAQEVKFAIDLGSPGVHEIFISTDVYNVNFRTLHDAVYVSLPTDATVNIYVQPTGSIGSTSVSVPAADTGDWPSGVTLNCYFEGRVQGKGGSAGAGATYDGSGGKPGSAGQQGGTAIKVRRATTFFGAAGKLWAGGGGGGGGASYFGNLAQSGSGGGGGGGAGLDGGPGAAGGIRFPAGGAGASGTISAGGSGGAAGSSFAGAGGAGGGPGLAGSAGGSSGQASGGAGGASGAAIDGVSFVTFASGQTLDIRGSQIN